MNKFKLLFLAIVVIFIIAFTGCGDAFIGRPYITSIYVNNETNNEYLIFVDNDFTASTIVSVKGNEKDFLIKEYPGPFETWDHEIVEEFYRSGGLVVVDTIGRVELADFYQQTLQARDCVAFW